MAQISTQAFTCVFDRHARLHRIISLLVIISDTLNNPARQ